MAVQITEPGYNGQLVSLAGVLGAPGKGRVMTSNSQNAATTEPLASANPKRISALIQNRDGALAGDIQLGGAGMQAFTLAPYGSLQIDVNFPWTGEIYTDDVSGASSNITIVEISVT